MVSDEVIFRSAVAWISPGATGWGFVLLALFSRSFPFFFFYSLKQVCLVQINFLGRRGSWTAEDSLMVEKRGSERRRWENAASGRWSRDGTINSQDLTTVLGCWSGCAVVVRGELSQSGGRSRTVCGGLPVWDAVR